MTRLYIKLFLFIVLVFLFTIVFLFNQFQAYPAEVDYFDDHHIDAAFDSRHRAKHLNIVPHPSTRLSHLSVSLSSDSLSQKIRSPNRGAAIRANRHRKKQQPRTQLEQPLEPGEFRSRKPNVPPRLLTSFVDKRNGNMDYACIRAGVVKYAYREARYWCKLDLVSDGGDKQIQIEASLYELAENHSQLYGTFILSCCCCSSNARVYSRSNTSSSDQHHPAGNSDLDLDKIYEWTLTDGIHESRIPITYRIPAQTPIGTYSVEYAVCVPYLFGTVYSKERLVELLELVEYTPPVEDIWYHGQLITITDCLYRNETLITVNNVKSQPRLDNRFTKCVLRPEMVFEQGIHHTSRVIQDHYKMPYMSPDDAILHHYKKDIANITSITSITSNHAQRFSARLNRTYQRTLQKIDQIN
ncbi:unnamed protein product [Anisakis simplex]|uniref:Glycosyltransferase family 92 protein n=1 Tax=Anisakis simplex TaxID=6269 RepID=A0A0M3K068_ANISI|nr:unnamed protein product [Anisakis simplex]